MPPKFKFTEDEIIAAALSVVRKSGMKGLTARALAQSLGCSAKPIFGLFKNMEELSQRVMDAAKELYEERIALSLRSQIYPPYKASGMEYVRFASEERELFKLLFMRDRSGEDIHEQISDELMDAICASTGFDRATAEKFHLEMWIFVHGIAVMTATGYIEWDMEYVSAALTDIYSGLKLRFKGDNHGSDQDLRTDKEIR